MLDYIFFIEKEREREIQTEGETLTERERERNKERDREKLTSLEILLSCFLSVVVITCPSHGQGRRFDPGREQSFLLVFNLKFVSIISYYLLDT